MAQPASEHLSDRSGSETGHGRTLRITDGEELPLSPTGIVFLFDVDNTLLDNDRVALDRQILARFPAADMTIDRIGDLLDHDFSTLRP